MTNQPRPTRVWRVERDAPDHGVIAEAARVLVDGGLVAFPTETVYGLGASAWDTAAVASIFRAKERPETDPLIVHLATAEDLAAVAATVPPAARALAARFWPGPLTLLVPKHDAVPPLVTAGYATVAVRVPAHPVAAALLQAAGVPVVAPSANRFTRPSPTTAAHVLADLDGRIDVVIDGGPTDIGVESTIVDCTTSLPVVRRAGGVTLEALRAVVGEVDVAATFAEASAPQVAPGQLLRHYAPSVPLTVYDGAMAAVVERVARELRQLVGRGQRVGVLGPDEALTALAPELAASAAAGRVVVEPLGPFDDPAVAAWRLFAALRRLEALEVDAILALGGSRRGVGAAVWDRLTRAADGRVLRV